MLKTFKWIYNLGVKAERSRVRTLIEEFTATVHKNELLYLLHDDKERAEEDLRQHEINMKAREVLNEMLQPVYSDKATILPSAFDKD